MASRKMSMLEKIANMLGVIYRHHEPKFPQYKATLKKIWFRELAPPTTKDWPQIKADYAKLDNIMRTQAYKDLPLKAFLAYTAVCLEMICWFFVGEIIGRRNIGGYCVSGKYIDPVAAKKMKKFRWDNKTELEILHDEHAAH